MIVKFKNVYSAGWHLSENNWMRVGDMTSLSTGTLTFVQ